MDETEKAEIQKSVAKELERSRRYMDLMYDQLNWLENRPDKMEWRYVDDIHYLGDKLRNDLQIIGVFAQ